jgi:hypothetical protein
MTDQEKTERRMVRVACLVPNGIMIRLQKDGRGDAGVPVLVQDGPGVRLNGPSTRNTGAGTTAPEGMEPGYTEVDAEWFKAWLDQHKMDPLVTGEHVYEDPEGEENPTPP